MEIKASNLRTGNIIFVEKYGIVEVLGIEQHSTDGDILYVWREGMQYKHRVRIGDTTPIPLTTEILEKAGFIKGYFTTGDQNIFCDPEQGVILLQGNDSSTYDQSFNCVCKYLHELQNLIFALTGEELNIQL